MLLIIYQLTYEWASLMAWSRYGNVFGGMASAGGGALGADVLPTGADGRPSNPARDCNLQG
eukprot:COSAG01_NODE_5617_length_4143_cov_2.188180_4_plen_61_part_00